MREEKDSLGVKTVPDDALYGIHTARSLDNFHVAGERVPLEIIYGMVKLKWACAKANRRLGLLPVKKAIAIVQACRRQGLSLLSHQKSRYSLSLDSRQSSRGLMADIRQNNIQVHSQGSV